MHCAILVWHSLAILLLLLLVLLHCCLCHDVNISGQATTALPWPTLIVDCRTAGGKLKVMPPPHQQQQQQVSAGDVSCSACPFGGNSADSFNEQCCADEEPLLWSVPAGNLDHHKAVSWSTLLVTATCAAVLIYRSIAVGVLRVRQPGPTC